MMETLFKFEGDAPDLFLNRLKSNGKSKYKRYRPLPLRYIGGKSLAVGHVVEHLPRGLVKITSPFFGGGSVEIALARELNIRVFGADIFDLLVNYWKHQIEHPVELADRIRHLYKPTKEHYNAVKANLKDHWEHGSRRTPFELAHMYWFNHNLSFGPAFLGWLSSIYENEKRFHSAVDKVRDFDVTNISVDCQDFAEVIQDTSEFLYCDPPYYLGGDSKMFIGLYPQRNFPIHHKGFKHELLRDLLHNHNHGFVLSYNDCSTIREWYKDFEIHEVSWQYTHGQGETRIGKNRKNAGNDHTKKSHELLIVKSV